MTETYIFVESYLLPRTIIHMPIPYSIRFSAPVLIVQACFRNWFKAAISCLLFCCIISLTVNAQVIKEFTNRYPVERIRGDFTLIGNKNLTAAFYIDTVGNGYKQMNYVNVSPEPGILNSSTARLVFSGENGSNHAETVVKFAGLYWTGRPHNEGDSPIQWTVSGVTLHKRKIWLKGPGAMTYTVFEANEEDIYYSSAEYRNMYAGFVDVTNYVKGTMGGVGQYTIANIALNQVDVGMADPTGFYGGWAIIVVYENPRMDFRDVIIFDGHAYVAGFSVLDYSIPVSGFSTTQFGDINMKLGMIAGEGDVDIPGDYFEIRNHSDTDWIRLSHPGNATFNFFNSSIHSYTDGVQNPRNPNYLNNYGLDISMFYVDNPQNSVITNNQTSTTFRYGSQQDTYIIFCIAMAVDAFNPGIYLSKSARPRTFKEAGDVIQYSFMVENTGNFDIFNIIVDDPLFNLTFGPIELAPGEIHTFTHDYTITQADVDAGIILNSATVSGWFQDEEYTFNDTITISIAPVSDILLSKTASKPTYHTAGEEVIYTFAVTNTGESTLHNVRVNDALTASVGLPVVPSSLLPGQTGTANAIYTIQQSDLDNGFTNNTATAIGEDPDGYPVFRTATETITAIQTPAMSLVKAASRQTYSTAGEEITYTFTVVNTGNVTLSNIRINDALTGSANLAVTPGILAPGQSGSAVAAYTITLEDLDRGSLYNNAFVYAFDPNGNIVTASGEVTLAALQLPAIRLLKSANPNSFSNPEEIINYSFTITNTGNVTLTDIRLTDSLTGKFLHPLVPATLVPGQFATATDSYVTLYRDVILGGVVNTAHAFGSDRKGFQVSDTDTAIASSFAELTVPNAFTPNGDGKNDVFKPLTPVILPDKFNMLIYDKWGQKLFETNSINSGWDGTFKGALKPAGVYTYIIHYEFAMPDSEHKAKMIRGCVMLMR